MGSRFIDLELICISCKKKNDGIFYAPTSNFYTFKCKYCKEINFITAKLKTKKVEDVTLEDVIKGFKASTSVNWTDDEIKILCTDALEQIKKEVT